MNPEKRAHTKEHGTPTLQQQACQTMNYTILTREKKKSGTHLLQHGPLNIEP
jgi:hypothetical protein